MGIVEANPAKGIRKAVPQPRDRRLSENEIIHLAKTITLLEAEGESPTGLVVIKLILLTGFRRNEALSLETSWLDGGLCCVKFPDTKTGRQTRTIGRAAAQLIKLQCLRSKSHFVFPADTGEGHFIGAPRSGKGVGGSEQSQCLFCAAGRFFRPGYHNSFVESWLPALDVQAGLKFLSSTISEGGFSNVRKAIETLFNMILEARP